MIDHTKQTITYHGTVSAEQVSTWTA